MYPYSLLRRRVWAIVVSQLTTSAVSFLILIKAANLKLRVAFHRKEFNELKNLD